MTGHGVCENLTTAYNYFPSGRWQLEDLPEFLAIIAIISVSIIVIGQEVYFEMNHLKWPLSFSLCACVCARAFVDVHLGSSFPAPRFDANNPYDCLSIKTIDLINVQWKSN